MSKIILDDFTEARTSEGAKTARFVRGVPMIIAPITDYDVIRCGQPIVFVGYFNCCSFVRTTICDQLYLVDPKINVNLLERWVREITPVYPDLDIRIINIPVSSININFTLSYDFKDTTFAKCIYVRYSNKKNQVDSYMAHHLIRALYHEQTAPFINQYFKIKKVLPDMYFWNIIFLCQFGFKMYHYFWFTDHRLLNMTTKKEFEKISEDYQGHSSMELLDKFKTSFPSEMLEEMKTLYLQGRFGLVASNLGTVRYVVPKEHVKKDKSNALRFFREYKVLFENTANYLIRNDEYYVKYYPKNNFNIVKT